MSTRGVFSGDSDSASSTVQQPCVSFSASLVALADPNARDIAKGDRLEMA